MPDWSDRLSDIHALLGEKLGVAGPNLRDQVRRAGRRLPRRARRDAELLVRAETMARHPRFARLVDPREVSRAERRLSHRLRAIDPRAQRRAQRLDRLAAVGLYVLVTFGLVVTLLWWRGLV
jgi:hypothetical protein